MTEISGLLAASEAFAKDLRSELEDALQVSPAISASWPVSPKTISEIGGRILEDWISCCLQNSRLFQWRPVAGRSIGDISLVYKYRGNVYTMLVDVKCANLRARDDTHAFYKRHGIDKPRPGESHPNLISVERARLWYSDESNQNSEIWILYLRYVANKRQDNIVFDLSPTLSSESVIFRLSDLSKKNLSVGALGKGQLQMKQLENIQIEPRTRGEFLALISSLSKQEKQRRTYR